MYQRQSPYQDRSLDLVCNELSILNEKKRTRLTHVGETLVKLLEVKLSVIGAKIRRDDVSGMLIRNQFLEPHGLQFGL